MTQLIHFCIYIQWTWMQRAWLANPAGRRSLSWGTASTSWWMGMSVGHFRDSWLVWEGQCGWGCPQAGGTELYKKTGGASHGKLTSKQHSSMACFGYCLCIPALVFLDDGLKPVSQNNPFLPQVGYDVLEHQQKSKWESIQNISPHVHASFRIIHKI